MLAAAASVSIAARVDACADSAWNGAMISRYLDEALHRARYVAIRGSGYAATVRGLRGVFAHARSLEACRAQLVEVVEQWVLVRVARGLPVPRLGKARIRVRRAS
jgi:predicted RNase H-like HicB family nuclease